MKGLQGGVLRGGKKQTCGAQGVGVGLGGVPEQEGHSDAMPQSLLIVVSLR